MDTRATTTALYRTWWPVVVDFAARRLRNLEEAEVVAQEALLRAIDVAQREEVARFSSLVLRIAHRLCVDRVRRMDWRADRADPDLLQAAQPSDTAELHRVRSAVDDLPAELREVVELRYVEGKTFAEIAEALTMSRNGVFARHQRAIDELRRSLFAAAAERGPPTGGRR